MQLQGPMSPYGAPATPTQYQQLPMMLRTGPHIAVPPQYMDMSPHPSTNLSQGYMTPTQMIAPQNILMQPPMYQ